MNYNKNNKNENQIKIIKNGKEISETEKNKNEYENKRKTMLFYFIPMVILIILGFIYVFTQINLLLIPFAILMFGVLMGWDGTTRTCPNCKKWNSVIWIKSKNISKVEEIKTKKIGKNNKKSKKVKVKYTVNQGKCKNCGCIHEIERQRFF